MTDETLKGGTEVSALDYVRRGRSVPPEVHKATLARASKLPGYGIIPEETETPLRKIYPATGSKVWCK